jgi:hypothetical protein
LEETAAGFGSAVGVISEKFCRLALQDLRFEIRHSRMVLTGIQLRTGPAKKHAVMKMNRAHSSDGHMCLQHAPELLKQPDPDHDECAHQHKQSND